MNQPDDDRDLDELIHSVDLDGLIRLIDARCDTRDWAGLLRTRDRCATATRETGRQLWPAATLAEYRLALRAPADWAAVVLDGESGRFAIGPLSEAIAVNHTWEDLEPHLPKVPVALFVAHERAIRGDSIPDADLATFPPVLDIPASLQTWEPNYPMSTYRDNDADHPQPDLGGALTAVEPPRDAEIVDDDSTALAVRQLFEPWSAASTGRVESVCVEGQHLDAIGALGVRSARVAQVDAADALAQLAWAGASGGAHGRRRGMAMGRFSMWWLLGAIGDLLDEWPPAPTDIPELLTNLRWYRWDAHEPPGGWRVQLAVEDVDEGVAWAINAADND